MVLTLQAGLSTVVVPRCGSRRTNCNLAFGVRPSTTCTRTSKLQASAGPQKPALNRPIVTYGESAQAPEQRPPLRPPTYVDPFVKVVEAEKTGETIEVKVKALNKGGLIATVGELKGFIPYNQLSPRSGQGSDLQYLVGQTLKAKVVSVDSSNGRKDFVLSERKAQQSEVMRNLRLGKVMKGRVSSVEDYGAFIELVDLPGVVGLVHKSELSWDAFMTVDSVVKEGQVVMVKVIDLDVAKCRLGLSMKQTQPDPIKTTLDTVQWGASKGVPTEIQLLMDRLKRQEGVEDVYIGRQAVEPKISSQELVVYMTKESTEDGFDVVARLGSVLQELHVVSKMSREAAKDMLASVVKS